MTKPAHGAGKPDLDALIRQAEMTVVESDRRWQRHVQALGPALRASRGQAAWAAAIGLGAVAATWLVVRRLRRGRDKPWPAASSRREALRRTPAPPPRSTGWRRFTELGGALVGSALRSGLAPHEGRAALPLLVSAGLPWLTRWWRARTREHVR